MARLLVEVPKRRIQCGETLQGKILLYNVDPRFIKAVSVRFIGYQVFEPMQKHIFLHLEKELLTEEVGKKLEASEPLQFAMLIPEKMLPASARISPKMLARYFLEVVVERKGSLRRTLKSTHRITVLGLCRPPDAVDTFKTLRRIVGFGYKNGTPSTSLFVDISYPFGNWLTPDSTFTLGLYLRSNTALPPDVHVERIRVILHSRDTYLTDLGDRASYNVDTTLRVWCDGIDISGKSVVDLSTVTSELYIPNTLIPSFETLLMERHYIMSVALIIRYRDQSQLIVSKSMVPIVGEPNLPGYEDMEEGYTADPDLQRSISEPPLSDRESSITYRASAPPPRYTP